MAPWVESLLNLVPSPLEEGSPASLVPPTLSVVVLNKTTLSLKLCRNPLPLPDVPHWLQIGPSPWQALTRPFRRVRLVTCRLALCRSLSAWTEVVVMVLYCLINLLQSLTLRLARKPTAVVVCPRPLTAVYCRHLVSRRVPTPPRTLTSRSIPLSCRRGRSEGSGFLVTWEIMVLLAQLVFRAPSWANSLRLGVSVETHPFCPTLHFLCRNWVSKLLRSEDMGTSWLTVVPSPVPQSALPRVVRRLTQSPFPLWLGMTMDKLRLPYSWLSVWCTLRQSCPPERQRPRLAKSIVPKTRRPRMRLPLTRAARINLHPLFRILCVSLTLTWRVLLGAILLGLKVRTRRWFRRAFPLTVRWCAYLNLTLVALVV